MKIMSRVHRNAAPFYWKSNNKVICLLIHGFTGSPSEMRIMGEYLKEHGFGVSCILLPGHGTTVEDLAGKGWHDWYQAIESEFMRLQKLHPDKKIIPIGLSMGGVLAIHLAINKHIAGLVLLSTSIYLKNWRVHFAHLLNLMYDYKEKPISLERWEEEIEQGQFSYRKTPVQAFLSLQELIKQAKEELPRIDCPALIIQSKNDNTVRYSSANFIFEKLGSDEKKLIFLEKSGHIITLGQERKQVFQAVEDFLRQYI